MNFKLANVREHSMMSDNELCIIKPTNKCYEFIFKCFRKLTPIIKSLSAQDNFIQKL